MQVRIGRVASTLRRVQVHFVRRLEAVGITLTPDIGVGRAFYTVSFLPMPDMINSLRKQLTSRILADADTQTLIRHNLTELCRFCSVSFVTHQLDTEAVAEAETHCACRETSWPSTL